MSAIDASHHDAQAVRDYGTTSHRSNGLTKHDVDPHTDESAYSDSSSEDEQAGVKTIEAIARTWSPWSLGLAYVG